MTEPKWGCPACLAPQITLDADGKVARHTAWYRDSFGFPERLRMYCSQGEGQDPVRIE